MSTQTVQGAIPTVTLGWRLQMALGLTPMTAQQIAEALGVNRGTVARWMHDKGAPPKRAYILQWALLTGANADWLQTGEPIEGSGPNGGGGAEVAPTI
ncbi:helix-turn-helix domain-containing protein [Luteipulveratus sp. YIM 133132]|uniref:helix-turn-helix domain-containing protein n=1 Tax=Luteipulveratus flavus TaxID=3031728 RepID=UPI0023AF9C6F|nr:helix-turn-helix domain-containing protein [Luteipulveratus sp. YIM 133132]MDE9364544.1 helix-turn-helix domain-containing protein [Luteipulveratus sp. YIM 133132]